MERGKHMKPKLEISVALCSTGVNFKACIVQVGKIKARLLTQL